MKPLNIYHALFLRSFTIYKYLLSSFVISISIDPTDLCDFEPD